MTETMLDRRLEMIASDWKARSDKGEMPASLYEAISEGSETVIDKKIIRNLARVSRIIDDDGAIRNYADFKQDWRYSHSTYGKTDTCVICGQSPIVENCIVIDDVRAIEIVIGNKCVKRYLEITDPKTGQTMSDEEREQFLRSETKTAKDEYTRQQWMTEHPSIYRHLDHYAELMASDPDMKRLHTGVSKRMVSHGFPGPKMRRQWTMFMSTAIATEAKWKTSEKDRKRMMRVRAEKAETKKRAFISALKNNRLRWHNESEEWLSMTEPIHVNAWEKEARLKVGRRIKNGQELSPALERFKNEMIIRTRLEDGDVVCDDEDFMLLRRMLDTGKLNGWEQSFSRSVMGRIAAGNKLTGSQIVIVDRLRARDRA